MLSLDPLVVHPRSVADLPPIDARIGPILARFRPNTAAVRSVQDDGVWLDLAETGQAPGAVLFVGASIEGVIRLALSGDEQAVSRSVRAWPLLRPRSPRVRPEIRLDSAAVVVSTPAVSVEVELDRFALHVRGADGTLLTELQQHDRGATGVDRGIPTGAVIGERDQVWSLQLVARPDEAFHGLGESSQSFDARGQAFTAWTIDAYGVGTTRRYKPVPFFVSTAGYGLLVDSGMPVELDLAAESAASVGVRVQDDLLAVHIIAGPHPSTILRRERLLTGPTALPPRWAFGLWMSTGFVPQTQRSVEAWLEQLLERDFPTDVVHIDPYWMRFGRWSDLAWDPVAFPEPRRMLDSIHRAGLRTCLWINPYIGTDSEQFAIGDAAGYFLHDASGRTWTGAVWGDDIPHAPTAIIDFTNPDAREWFSTRLGAVLRDGADVFKTDFGEGVPVDAVAFNGSSGLELHNVYPLLYNELVADVTEQVNGHRLVWGRSSYLGGQRHAAQWGGDTSTDWAGMASTLRAGLSYAMSGSTFWSHDIGGFDGIPTAELFVRWAEWGVLSPLSRMHGTSSRIPWEWDGETEERLRAVVQARYDLLPHILSEATRAAAADEPLLRPVLLETPGDPRSWGTDSCYLFGHDLLVAPARGDDGGILAVLPQGQWVEWDGAVVHPGGSVLRAPLRSTLPVLVRAGAIIPSTTGLRRVPDHFGDVRLTIWRPMDTTRIVHEEDMRTTVKTEVDDGSVRVDLQGPLDVSSLEIRAPASAVTTVIVNGISWPISRATGALIVSRPGSFATTP